MALGGQVQTVNAVVGNIHHKAFRAQPFLKVAGQFFFVFNHQNFHRNCTAAAK